MLDLQPDSRVVDLGCGEGRTLVEIGARLGPAGQLVGVDQRARAVPDDLAGDPRVQLIAADLERQVPFRDGQFDRAVCHNTLEALTDHDAFLAEAWRILTPGGLLVLGHSDFDTLVFTSEDLALTRRLVHCFCDATQAWMRTSDGTIGRRLVGIVGRSRFRIDRVLAWVNVHTSFEPGTPGHEMAHAVANIGRRDPSFDLTAINEWLDGLARVAADGSFLYSVNDYVVTAQKP